MRFAVERFLYRLGASPMRDRCVLKGAALLTLWMRDPYRASRDIDLLASGPDDDAAPCPEDGLRFDIGSLEVSPIREADSYHGQRAVMRAYLGKAVIRVQVDFGFGDAVTPAPEESVYPTLLETLPAPKLRTYPRATSVAEKFEAMVKLGRRNSRMKDFHDLWSLSSTFAFEGPTLRDAVEACFERRGTRWTPEVPEVLSAAFYEHPALQSLWSAYLRSGQLRTPPPARFEEIGERVRGLLLPVRDSIVGMARFDRRWAPGGPWL